MRPAVFLAALLLLVAGCTAPPDQDVRVDDPPAEAGLVHALQGAIEPAEFTVPTFLLRGAVAAGGPLYGAGEPGIWAAMDGSLYVSFPGCDDGPYYFVSVPNSETCGHGLIWKSTDLGETWTRLNRHPDGLLTEDGPPANGDADVTADSAGNVYASNLGGGGIQFHRSQDGGATWQYMANLVPPTADPEDDPDTHEGADRQWFAGAGPGHVINAWMRTSPKRDVEVNTTFDGGLNWTGNLTFGDGIGWVGPVQFAPDGTHAYIPYTQPTSNGFEMHVVGTADGGRNWTDVATGMTWSTPLAGSQWSGGHMAPALDVTGDGTVVVAMAIDVWATPDGIAGPSAQGTAIVVRTSSDDGKTWGETSTLRANAPALAGMAGLSTTRIFPWVTGGAGDRFAITYFTNPLPVDNNQAGGVWSLEAVVCDGASTGALDCLTAVIDPNVHEGPICTQGGGCTGPGDRALLDYFESDVTPDGRLVVVYPADPVQSNKAIEIRVAVQDGGSFLLQRPTTEQE
ncbi:MAG: sialidase family protein [Candidatus Thermoplasmatota archaeon]